MSDDDILELAAKAAGLDVELMALSGFNIMSGPGVGKRWNPLASDGDAFRLMVKLNLTVQQNAQHVWVYDYPDFAQDKSIGTEICEATLRDRDVATRRAIVRCAAEIGKSIEQK